ncbi:MAG: hypothetical protein NTW50_04225 [Candidatus Berkelbacteria bacterium]|nr:hypothetical protein [Candidatus Berkelbacteria bacterium]
MKQLGFVMALLGLVSLLGISKPSIAVSANSQLSGTKSTTQNSTETTSGKLAFSEVKGIKVIPSDTLKLTLETGYLEVALTLKFVSKDLELKFNSDLVNEKNPLVFQTKNSGLSRFVTLEKVKSMTKLPSGAWLVVLTDNSNFEASWHLPMASSFYRDGYNFYIPTDSTENQNCVYNLDDIYAIQIQTKRVESAHCFKPPHGGPVTVMLGDGTVLKVDEGHIIDFCDLRPPADFNPYGPNPQKKQSRHQKNKIQYCRQHSSLVGSDEPEGWHFQVLEDRKAHVTFHETISCWNVRSIEFLGGYSKHWLTCRKIKLTNRDGVVTMTNLYLESDDLQDFFNSKRDPKDDYFIGKSSEGQFAVSLDFVAKISFPEL